MYHFFIGIDISKDTFSVALYDEKKIVNYQNSMDGFKQFFNEFQTYIFNTLIVLETTGGYEIELIYYLQQKQFSVHRANTRKVKNFIRSFGILGKSDQIDAACLALYGAERYKQLELYSENPHKKLLKLVQRRNDLKSMLVQEKNRLKAPDQKDFTKSFQTIIEAIEAEIKKIEFLMDEFCKTQPHFHEIKNILKTITGIGEITATQLLALLPELGHLNRKKIASLGGVAPHPYESGKKKGHRFVRGGRQDIKPVLFISAMTAARSKGHLGEFYKKLVDSGKKKMVALTALMRKILVIANAKVRDFLSLQKISQHG